MDLMTLPRAAFTSYLGAVKWPLDTGLKLVGREDGPTGLAVDRADGTVRTIVGSLLRDDTLQQDGIDRLNAVEQRTKAARLRAESELRRERAEQEYEETEEQAEQRRRVAAEQAAERKERAEQQANARKRQATASERRRKQASERAEATVEASIDDRAKRERLETLEQQTAALDQQDDALTARDEAQRLAAAASDAKAARKSD